MHSYEITGEFDDPITEAELIGERNVRVKLWRDNIAEAMWTDYVAIVRARNIPHPTIR